jgi:hypothetical protein
MPNRRVVGVDRATPDDARTRALSFLSPGLGALGSRTVAHRPGHAACVECQRAGRHPRHATQ